MHLHALYTGPDLLVHAAPAPPFGSAFAANQIVDAGTLEVRVTSLVDVADTMVWSFLRAGRAIAVAQVGGR